ncbi:uncharacterized protein LOC105664021 isoform X2 [Megachile rotundata]|uniref:uncharacterized protein LOC105664021 isoform X2 n=1 Tax=Megachile rotundata TaxID=143995 RepID=UPI000614F2DB|nr:PREDICTED: uncharacterized protein LOC105664021 isoform X2 [Megachile rotundata]
MSAQANGSCNQPMCTSPCNIIPVNIVEGPPDNFCTVYSAIHPFTPYSPPYTPCSPRSYSYWYSKYQPYTTLRNVCSITCPPYTSSVYRC